MGNIQSFCDTPKADASNAFEKKGWTSGRNIADFCNYLTFEIMGDLCFWDA